MMASSLIFALIGALLMPCQADPASERAGGAEHDTRQADQAPSSRLEASSERVREALAATLEDGDAAAVLHLASGYLAGSFNLDALKRPDAPGSVLKLVAATTLARERGEDRGFRCSGKAEILGETVACWTRAGHGHMHLGTALALSCNLYFVDLASRLESGAFLDTFRSLGFDRSTGFAAGEQVLPLPEALTRREAVQAVLGECDRVRPTGLQLLKMAAILSGAGPLGALGDPTDEAIRQGMADAVSFGTAGPPLRAMTSAAKTGTARMPGGWRYQGWCVGFAPVEAPLYAFVFHKARGIGADAASLARDWLRTMVSGPGEAERR